MNTQAIDFVTFDFKGSLLLSQRLYRLPNQFLLSAKRFYIITVGNVM